VATDLLRMKPKIFSGPELTWRHLAASCAIPGLFPQRRIDGRWCSDGGLLNPLPVWAAAGLGATRIVAIHVLPQVPSAWLKPLARAFAKVAGYRPALPANIELVVIQPEAPLGPIRDALWWRSRNIERWIEAGYRTARNISIPDCIGR
ncbi:MAG: patatin-like phospholipase family protein, partial [Bryobacteraceae bacterium]